MEHHSEMVCSNVVTVHFGYGAIYDVSYRFTIIVLGLCIRDNCITLNRAPSKSVEATPYELWFGKKPKLSFLKVWGCNTYVKRLQPNTTAGWSKRDTMMRDPSTKLCAMP